MLFLQLGPRQPLVPDIPGSIWGPLNEVPGLQMRLIGLRSGGTHSCLRSSWAGVAKGHCMHMEEAEVRTAAASMGKLARAAASSA